MSEPVKVSLAKQAALCVATGVLAALVAVTAVNQTSEDSAPAFLTNQLGQTFDETVTVGRADIRSQFTVPGTIVDNPTFLILAGRSGEVSHAAQGGLLNSGGTIGEVSGNPVLVPRQVELLEWLVPDGSTVTAGLPVAKVRLVGFAVSVAVAGSDGYRLLAGSELMGRATIDAGPGPFDCPVVQPAETEYDDVDAIEDASAVRVLCLVPDDVLAVADVPATLLITNAVVKDALVLPVTAVRGLVETGEVTVVADGVTARRSVGLGVTDGVIIEIKAGLAEGDQVSADAPPLNQS